ncbi:ABC transporter permease [Mucisphaera calidilacus]|uniref:Macrolide export ATP-binding/permease protein MacB n=1 Tax=Mucisphaera calidilacus TaxID=2527982 RepID=A0A518BTV0_9BACT|nr:ABC transporter permease [Mucisphaera calidilacus]QDU70395.1 Macrolide export ATP-binding/permease protein MacB [Mucisphaera calidilacus]
MTFLIETLRLGLTNLLLHKLRSLLTMLGIIFGVAAVIAMVAIGEGSKQKALEEIAQLGARNIIIQSRKPEEDLTATNATQRMVDYGIKRIDLKRIRESVAGLEHIVPLKRVGNRIRQRIHGAPAEVYGTTPELLDVTALTVARGRYLEPQDLEQNRRVAVLGSEIAEQLFPLDDPLGGVITIDNAPFRVVGILAPTGVLGGNITSDVGRNLNYDLHIPLTAAENQFGDMLIRRRSGSFEATKVELQELILVAESEKQVLAISDRVRRILELEHAEKNDVALVVPLELLAQVERTQRLFNLLMVAIASISLLVGGIGIMNIMLATVTERTREIGIRRALGATRGHIIAQFLVETTTLSGLGGALGVGVGLSLAGILALIHAQVSGLEMPIVTMWSILVSFGVATAVGVIFGLYPAVQAARQDPIVALRHD